MPHGEQSSLRASGLKTALAYATMIHGTIALFLWMRSAGSHLVAPDPVGSAVFGVGEDKAKAHALLHVLLALVVVILASRGLGAVFKHLHQPPVIGEVLAGILLGPSLKIS